MRRWSADLDRILRSRFIRAMDGSACLAAAGGYGRGKLAPHADADLFILLTSAPDSRQQTDLEAFLRGLWDDGLEVAQRVFTVDEGLKLCASDPRTWYSCVTVRRVAGDPRPLVSFRKGLALLLRARRRAFVHDLFEEIRRRHERFGLAYAQIDPHMKEGAGGLRDYDLTMAAARALYGLSSFSQFSGRALAPPWGPPEVRRAVRLLHRIRCWLHFHYGRRYDRLSADVMEPMAADFGYAGRDAEVKLRCELARGAYLIHHYTRIALDQMAVNEKIRCDSRRRTAGQRGYRIAHGFLFGPRRLKRGLNTVIEACHLAARRRVEPAPTLWIEMERVARRSSAVGWKIRRSFLKFCRDVRRCGPWLEHLHRCGALGRIVPEWTCLAFQAQREYYHVYTVDLHTIRAVGELSRIFRETGEAVRPIRSIRRPHVLTMGLLLHDVGKGRGGGHVEKGAHLSLGITRAFGLDQTDQEDVEFLVRHHLLLTHLSQQRNVKDPNLIVRMARLVRDRERLDMLFVLSLADARAVGPGAWTQWKEILLQDLHRQLGLHLAGGGRIRPADGRLARRIAARLSGANAHWIRYFLQTVPGRYAAEHPPDRLARDITSLRRLSRQNAVITFRHVGNGYSEITIYCLDRRGLFSEIVGVLSYHNLNVVDAEITTTADGRVIDTFRLTDVRGRPVTDRARWKRIAVDLRRMIDGGLDVAAMMDKKRRPTALSRGRPSRHDPSVEISNDLSDDHTVVDVYASDRPGLLFDIARVMKDQSLTIDLAKVSTRGDQVADTFYVKDVRGRKLASTRVQDALRKRLLEALPW